jgi:hypothetical protein
MPEHAEDEAAGQPQVVGVAFGVSGRLGPLGAETAGPGAGPAGAGTQEDEAGPGSRRPKPGTSRAPAVSDEGDPGEGTAVALFQPNRDDRERDG